MKNHVVLCLSSSADSPETGLVNFVLPLRSSCFRDSELKDIVIIGDRGHLDKEWGTIANFPRIYWAQVGVQEHWVEGDWVESGL